MAKKKRDEDYCDRDCFNCERRDCTAPSYLNLHRDLWIVADGEKPKAKYRACLYDSKSGCRGCVYFKSLSESSNDSVFLGGSSNVCHYLIETGKQRNCEAGVNCIRRKEKKHERKNGNQN